MTPPFFYPHGAGRALIQMQVDMREAGVPVLGVVVDDATFLSLDDILDRRGVLRGPLGNTLVIYGVPIIPLSRVKPLEGADAPG